MRPALMPKPEVSAGVAVDHQRPALHSGAEVRKPFRGILDHDVVPIVAADLEQLSHAHAAVAELQLERFDLRARQTGQAEWGKDRSIDAHRWRFAQTQRKRGHLRSSRNL